MTNVKGYLAARSRQTDGDNDAVEKVEDSETSAIITTLHLVGMKTDTFNPSESQLVETWVLFGLVSVAPIVEEIFE